MPYLTLTENLKLQQRPGLVASNDIQEMEWVYSGTNTHTIIIITELLQSVNTTTPTSTTTTLISNLLKWSGFWLTLYNYKHHQCYLHRVHVAASFQGVLRQTNPQTQQRETAASYQPAQLTSDQAAGTHNTSTSHWQNYSVWWSGVVVSTFASINEVNLRRARLVLRWVTV